jgi:hypothetical protein
VVASLVPSNNQAALIGNFCFHAPGIGSVGTTAVAVWMVRDHESIANAGTDPAQR